MVPRKLWLGNHGSAKNPENVVLEPARPTTPTPSTQSFVTPTSTVKSGPSIRDLIHDPVPASTATDSAPQPQEPIPTPTKVPVPQAETQTPVSEDVAFQTSPEEIVEPQPIQNVVETPSVQNAAVAQTDPEVTVPQPGPEESVAVFTPQETPEADNLTEVDDLDDDDDADPDHDNLLPYDDISGEKTESVLVEEPRPQEAPQEPVIVKRPPADPEEDPATFQIFWESMVEAIFADMPTLHEPLKHYHPVRKENILIIPVKNDIQENDFAPRKHQVLRYLRDNWDEALDDIEVKLEVNMETKKFILDDNDKLNALREQNPDVVDFIRSLNLRIKH